MRTHLQVDTFWLDTQVPATSWVESEDHAPYQVSAHPSRHQVMHSTEKKWRSHETHMKQSWKGSSGIHRMLTRKPPNIQYPRLKFVACAHQNCGYSQTREWQRPISSMQAQSEHKLTCRKHQTDVNAWKPVKATWTKVNQPISQMNQWFNSELKLQKKPSFSHAECACTVARHFPNDVQYPKSNCMSLNAGHYTNYQ